MKISFIGYGNIAQAMAKGLANHLNYELRAAAPSLPIGVNTDNVSTHYDNLAILNDTDVIIIAVKPSKVAEVLAQIKPAIPPHCLLISLATAYTLSWLEKHSGANQAIIRAMPNTPIAIKKGATPLIANQFVSRDQKEFTTQLFQCLGMITWIKNENQMDIFTALSGSGPAYVFLFLEAMMYAAEELGLEADIAKAFAIQTMSGAVELASTSEHHVNELRKKVTSAGGTTSAAIKVFEEEKLMQIVSKSMNAAIMRAKELSVE